MSDQPLSKPEQVVSGVQRSHLHAAVDELAGADYQLGCAAARCERAGRDDLRAEADRLMRECVALRVRINGEATQK